MEPRVYRMNRPTQIFYCAFGVGIIGAGIFVMLRWDLGIILFIPLVILGIYQCWWGLSPRLTLTETEISVSYLADEHSARLSDIESWRTESGGRSGLFWVLTSQDNSISLRISQNFAVDDVFLDFLSKLRCLDDLEMSIAP